MSDEIKNAEEKSVQDEIEQTEDVSVNEQSSDEKAEGILGEYKGKKSAKAKKEKKKLTPEQRKKKTVKALIITGAVFLAIAIFFSGCAIATIALRQKKFAFGDASLCSNDLVFFFGEFFSDDFTRARIGHKVVQANGETYFVAEVENFVKFFFGAVFENELANRTECDHFTVHAASVNVVDCGEAVVNCVCRCKTAGFKAETGKKNVGFNYLFKCRSYDVAVASDFCFCAVADKVAIAKLCKCRSSVSAVAEQRAFFTVCSAGETCVDVGYTVDVGSCLEVCGKCVAHTAYEEARRSVCDDVEVDKNYGRALTEVCVIVKLVIVRVKNCGVRGRCVGCRDSGADDERIACCDAF